MLHLSKFLHSNKVCPGSGSRTQAWTRAGRALVWARVLGHGPGQTLFECRNLLKCSRNFCKIQSSLISLPYHKSPCHVRLKSFAVKVLFLGGSFGYLLDLWPSNKKYASYEDSLHFDTFMTCYRCLCDRMMDTFQHLNKNSNRSPNLGRQCSTTSEKPLNPISDFGTKREQISKICHKYTRVPRNIPETLLYC